MIPSPGPRAGSQMPEISWRGAGPGFDASFTGRPQPSRSAGADEGACWPFCAACLAAGAPWDRADIDDPNTINMMRTEIAKLLGIFCLHRTMYAAVLMAAVSQHRMPR